MKALILGLASLPLFLWMPSLCMAQTSEQLATAPSSAELLELANKADEKVTEFERVLRAAAPEVDKESLDTDLDAAQTAHTLINVLRKQGATTYGLVSLLATLDDLSLDASRASRTAIFSYVKSSTGGNPPNQSALASMQGLAGSEKSIYDISELFMHATLRYVTAESNMMEKVISICNVPQAPK